MKFAIFDILSDRIWYFWNFLIHQDEKSTKDSALIRVVWGEEEKGVTKDGKGAKETWFCELRNGLLLNTKYC